MSIPIVWNFETLVINVAEGVAIPFQVAWCFVVGTANKKYGYNRNRNYF